MELQEAIEADPPQLEGQRLGDRVAGWIAHQFQNALTGASKIGAEVVAGEVTKVVKNYFGVP